ncbi:hypothetical protein BJ912DRAFT_966277 [Pholiota molesta]|nr:hypothetical protein BJ912DRAFT_966277 [Pholiota molesta]
MSAIASHLNSRHCQRQCISSLGHWLPRAIWVIMTFGLCRVFYKTWPYVPRAVDAGSDGLPFVVNTNHGFAEWNIIVGKLKKQWKQICLGCALILSLAVALLQIDLVLKSTIGRTTAIMSFIFSSAGLVLGTSFRLIIHRSKDGKCPNQWIKASQSLDNLESIRFWSFPALPLSLLVWSVIFCFITVLGLPWAVQNGSAESGSAAMRRGEIISVSFLMILTAMVIAPVYRGIKFARELC